MNFVILHGTDADHTSNWFPWLKAELESRGHAVWVPDLPGTGAPDAEKWTDFLLNSGYDFSESILIGHSAGAVEITALLQSLDKKVRLAILVGIFRGDLGWDALRGMDIEFDYDKIRHNSEEFLVIHSDNDPHCPLDDAKWIAERLDAGFVLMPGKQHFSTSIDPDFTQFPELLEIIEKELG